MHYIIVGCPCHQPGAGGWPSELGRGDDTVGNPHRAQISHIELFELFVSSNLDKQFPIELFERR